MQNEYKEYFISPVNNILYHKHNDGIYEIQQLVVPECRRNQILEMAHSSFLANHQSYQKTLFRIEQNFHWPKIRQQVTKFCKSCHECQLIRKRTVCDDVIIKPVGAWKNFSQSWRWI